MRLAGVLAGQMPIQNHFFQRLAVQGSSGHFDFGALVVAIDAEFNILDVHEFIFYNFTIRMKSVNYTLIL